MFKKIFEKFTETVVIWIAAAAYGILFLIVGSALSPVQADEEGLWLTTGEWSRHTDEDKHNYRQNNTGIGLQYDLSEDQSLVVGYYNNSVHRETVYMGSTYTPFHTYGIKLGVVGVVATGYCQYLPASPLGGFYASYSYQKVGVSLMWLPNVVVAAQLRYKIGGGK